MYEVKLTYFKETGKYYSNGSYTSFKEQLFDIMDEVREKQAKGILPGMVEGYRAPFLTIDVPDHPNNHPRLCILTRKEEAVEEKKPEDPIELVGGLWYFWDEIWVNKYGPYHNKHEAERACAEYCKTLERHDPRPLSLVKYCGDIAYYPDVLNPWKRRLGPFLFLGEIPNMPGHCVLATRRGDVHFGFHTDHFEELPDESEEE
jgi:hypothetical protein